MHDGVQYDPIEGQGQGHEPFKVGNSAIFNGYGPWRRHQRQQWGLKSIF